MEPQKQIKRTLSEGGGLLRLRRVLAGETFPSREAAVRSVCREFGFRDARGRLQVSSCLQVLKELDAWGAITLPAAARRAGTRRPPSPRRLGRPVPPPDPTPASVSEVRSVTVSLAATAGERALWNEMMAREHPRGTATFFGRQLRYLVGSEHGWLGGLGFSSSALQVAARDAWIGWDPDRRRERLDRVVCMSRFLIRPGVSCRNLASHVLGRTLARLGDDFEARYGMRPLLAETYVEPERDGASLRAANWVRVGVTTGRGRQDRDRAMAESVKTIYMYALARDWRTRLRPAPSLKPGEGLDSDVWARNEFGGAPLGDRRLSERLVLIAHRQGESPMSSFTALARHDPSGVRAYYRFIGPAGGIGGDAGPTFWLRTGSETLQRMRGQDTVLCIQDGSDLRFATRPNCVGLGVIGTNQTSSRTRGLHLHATLAVSGDGLPLGLLRMAFDAPTPKGSEGADEGAASAGDKDGDDASAPVGEEEEEDKARKSRRWIDGVRDIAELARATPGARLFSVMDREADFFELFDEARRSEGVEMLHRARADRVPEPRRPKLFARVRKSERRGADADRRPAAHRASEVQPQEGATGARAAPERGDGVALAPGSPAGDGPLRRPRPRRRHHPARPRSGFPPSTSRRSSGSC